MDMEVPQPEETKEEEEEEEEDGEDEMKNISTRDRCTKKLGFLGGTARVGHQPWDSIISKHAKSSMVQQCLATYRRTDEEGSLQRINGHSFVSLLKDCMKLRDLETGKEIHGWIAGTGLLERDPFVGATLVDMYAKCGCLTRAEDAFEELRVRNVVPWTILMTAYADNGHAEKAVACFEKMQFEGVSPNAHTFISALKACSSIGAIGKGEEILMDIRRQGLLENIYVGSALVDMYVKWGALDKAQEVFFELPIRNVVIWTALLAGFVQHGVADKAHWCFQQMQLEGVPPNAVTYACSLKASSILKSWVKGREIHTRVQCMGLLEKDLYVGSSLVDMYTKCGSISIAERVFGDITFRNVVLWNTLIAGYTEYGQGEEALQCFVEMRLEGISPDAVTFMCGLKACSIIGALGKAQKIHAEIETQGFVERDLAVGNTLVDVYAKCGLLIVAQTIFNRLLVRNIVSWNALIAGYTENGYGEKALELFKKMQLDDILPDAVTYLCILKACASIEGADKAEEILADAEKHELLNNIFIGSTLVDMYAKCGSLAKGQAVFNNLPLRDVVAWNSLITAFAEYGHGEEALHCLEKMQFEGVSPNAVTFLLCLKACSSIGATNKGQEIHAEIERRGMVGREHIGNTLVDMYAKCGLVEVAHKVFNQLPLRDVVSWTALIMGYAQRGQSDNVFGYFDKMVAQGIKPNPVTLVVILSACSRSGLLNKSQTYFEAMSKDLGLSPTLKHHACIIDIVSRSGHLEEAAALIKRLPNFEMWHMVLGASWNFGNLEFGRQAFGHATLPSTKK